MSDHCLERKTRGAHRGVRQMVSKNLGRLSTGALGVRTDNILTFVAPFLAAAALSLAGHTASGQAQRKAPPEYADFSAPTGIQAALDSAYGKFKDTKEGANADYIPALAKVDPNIYGIVLVTANGKV